MFSRVFLMLFVALSISVVCSSRTLGPVPGNPPTKVYLVTVDGGLYHNDCNQYQLLLKKVLHQRSPKKALVYCFTKVISGFAAELTHEEAEKLKSEKGVIGVTEQNIDSEQITDKSYRFPKDINN